jgi:Holliday junction resolvase RusA-like endonuclease
VITVEVAGRAAPKGSRIMGHTKAGKSFTRPASKFEKPWVDEVKQTTQVVMRHHAMPEPPYDVDLYFYIARPKNPRYGWPVKADIDKLARAALDGLVLGGALRDDKHVTALTVRTAWATTHAPGVTAQIRRSESAVLAA